jgi:hypothetical protein
VLISHLHVFYYVLTPHTRLGLVNPILQFEVFLDDLHVLMLLIDEIQALRAVLDQPGDFLFLSHSQGCGVTSKEELIL